MNYFRPDQCAVGVLMIFSAFWLWGGALGAIDLLVGLYLLWASIGSDDDDDDEDLKLIYGA